MKYIYGCAMHASYPAAGPITIQCRSRMVMFISMANFGHREHVTRSLCGITPQPAECTGLMDLHTQIVKDSCEGRESCVLEPHTGVFGDPCPGVYKYLEVLYQCM